MNRFFPILLILLSTAQGAGAQEADPLAAAYQHRQKGRYAEAEEALKLLVEQQVDPIHIAMELSQVKEATGQWKEATEILEAAAKTSSEHPALLSRLAEVYFQQGRYQQAEQTAAKSIQLDGNLPRAHLVLGETYTETGRLDKAIEEYVWFIRYYNREQPKDAETLALVAEGSLQYARWKGSTQILKFVVNTLCPDAIKADETHWQAHWIAGRLLLEKYNRAQALPELRRALAINPLAADALVSLGNAAYQQREFSEAEDYARQALKINPQHLAALWLLADLKISAGQFSKALEFLQTALAFNPHEQRTLARQAAIHVLQNNAPPAEDLQKLLSQLETIDQVKIDNPDPFSTLVIDLVKRNPRPGYFFSMLAETLESRRKYDLAETFYRQAIVSMPQLAEPKTALGMLYVRVGKTDEAAKLLDEAFEADPFHVRVSNMRKVLKLLDGYETIATDHFIIRVDSEFDKVLGQYVADYLEEIYPELTQQFGYEPEHRTHFEIYNQSKGLSAHQWFSARMVGLPWIQTIGASTGVIVALASPTATPEPFNWARVLKHEFVHVITLQQTKFNVPHWFTEALAVTAEGGARPEIWNQLLLERVPQGNVRSLDELNEGFIRPKSPEDWQFAYCQSRLYAQYMIETHGQETIPKLLEAYRQNTSTDQAIPKVFGVDKATFEKGYREFLDKLVAELQGGKATKKLSLAELEKAYQANPNSPAAIGHYAAGLLEARSVTEARKLAEKAIALDQTQPEAAVVLATLELRSRNVKEAISYLEPALADPPHRELLALLARLKLANENRAEARDLYRRGQKAFPHEAAWWKGLATVALQMDDEDSLKTALKELIERETDNASYPKKLAELALAENDYPAAVLYAKRTLYVDVMDAEVHRMLAEAYEQQNQHKRAITEYKVSLQLEPATAEAELGLARSYLKENLPDEAKKILKSLLMREPDHEEARKLLDQAAGT